MTHQVGLLGDTLPADPAAPRPDRSPLSMLLGLCGLLAVWILVMPPFAGSDEFDHAYRAAAAARGQWAVEPVAATRGTGAFLTVPTDIVEAARDQCQYLEYTKDHDCVGTPAGAEDRIVASGAGRYHPLFYAVIGTAAKPFDGSVALFAMRAATAALAAAFVALAALAAATFARSRWPYLGIAVACTPVALYSCAIAAPNGVEMMSALALWMALAGLLLAPADQVRRLAVLAAVSGAVLATLRPLGPLWCLLTFAAVLVTFGADTDRLRALARRPAVLGAAGMVFLSALQSTAWVLAVDALKVSVEEHSPAALGEKLGAAAALVPAWILQSIAAFPLRNNASHPAVYACYLILFGVVVLLGIRCASTRVRVGIAVVIAVSLLLPYLMTVQSWDLHRGAWQGRYGLPLAMGIVVLGVCALDRSGRDLRGPVRLLLLLLFVVAQTLAVSYTLVLVQPGSQVGVGSWMQPSLVLTVLMAGASAALLWRGAFGPVVPAEQRSQEPT